MKNKIACSFLTMLLTSVCLTAEINHPHLIEIECTVTPIDREKIHPKTETTETAIAENTSKAFSSNNWSGYASTSTTGAPGSVTYAAGSWIVPTIIASTDATFCSIWVGIDGFNSPTVQQIGTAHNWENDAQNNYAWFEMYPLGAYIINGFPVDRGDMMSARVGYKGGDQFKLVIMNHTKGVATTVPMAYTTAANTLRVSAEWVVEAPFSNAILPLSNFGLETFNYCSAYINNQAGSISDNRWVYDTITMGNSAGVKAKPGNLLKNGNCFQVTWEHE
jgi:hypothetical protein